MISNRHRYSLVSRSAIALLTLVALVQSVPTLADGGFFYPPYWRLWENAQTAFIQQADGRENLKILPGFHGDAMDFAWVIPVPGLPTVSIADTELFMQATTMTQPIYRNRDSGWGCNEEYDFASFPDGGVDIISDELVGMYRTVVISADSDSSLVDYLETWGFLHPGYSADVSTILASYVERGWYFVALKVDQEALEEGLPNLYDYWYGQMEPIHLSFASEEMIYPLRISSLSSANSSQITIYTVGRHRMDFPGAETWYANRISASELASINNIYPAVGAELTEGDFLTKLVRTYSPAQMSEDLILTPADSDEEFRPINYSGVPWFGLLFLGSSVVWVVFRISSTLRRRQREKAHRINF